MCLEVGIFDFLDTVVTIETNVRTRVDEIEIVTKQFAEKTLSFSSNNERRRDARVRE